MYDSAHAFSVKKDNKSILNQGDLSVLSFMQQRYLTRLREEQLSQTTKR